MFLEHCRKFLLLNFVIANMNSLVKLRDYLDKFVQLTEDEKNEFTSYFRERSIKKKQFIVQPDFISNYRTYIIKGAFRAYVVPKDFEENTILFAIEDWWILDYSSYIFQQPATMFVVALEDKYCVTA
jgi:hypothetical protein